MNVEEIIRNKLTNQLGIGHLEVVNESHGHNVAPGSETHFKVVLVSEDFLGVSKVARHQKVYAILAQELAGGVHALALHTYTPEEWQAQESAPQSPNCMGGAKR